jgi:hexosaminidase
MMNIVRSTCLVILISTGLLYTGNIYGITQKQYNRGINITPAPLELKQHSGKFLVTNDTKFVTGNDSLAKIAEFFIAKINIATGYNLQLKKGKTLSNSIHLSINANISVNNEGYILVVTAKGVDIHAKTLRGVFYGLQTMLQLLPAEIESNVLVNKTDWSIPAVTIKDEPRFGYRGMHLDVSRHFFDVNFIKKQLDVLAMFKINKFHWHLTDDQGWRIEISKYPKLTEISAKRVEGDGTTYGPHFYTQEQIKEVVAYAKIRFIEVIPEIEMPGHAVAVLTAYPQISCTGGPFEVRNVWGISDDVFCAGNEATFTFIETVISEIAPLFESQYIHIGGDECPKKRWKDCPKCQAKIKELNLVTDSSHTAEERLQSYFIKRVEKILQKNNKKLIGWDEILEGGLAPSATVMSWRGEKGGIAAANLGHDVIMTPQNWMYLNHYQGDSKVNPGSNGQFTDLNEIYHYEPTPTQLDKDKVSHILGAQANVWSEYMYTPDIAEWRIYPRIIALSEIGWSANKNRDYSNFLSRIDNQRVRLDMHDIHYYIPFPEQKGTPSCNFIAFTDTAKVEFKTTEPVKMVYTIDGSNPTLQSMVYEHGLTFTENTTLKILSVLPSGKMGVARTIEIKKETYLPAIKGENIPSGINAAYYQGRVAKVTDLDGKQPTEKEQIATPLTAKYRVPGYGNFAEDKFYSTVLNGYINIPADGIYYFSTTDELWLQGEKFISNEDESATARRFSLNDKSIALAKGLHPFKLIRLGAIFGGWPTQWENLEISIRRSDETEFKVMGAPYFK